MLKESRIPVYEDSDCMCHKNAAQHEASEGRQAGITFLTVAAEPWLDRYVLSAIASFPHQHNMIVADSYAALSSSEHVRDIVDAICNSQQLHAFLYT